MQNTASKKQLSDFGMSKLGLGCASAWGQEWFSEQKAFRVVERALELGITTFDTGASYSGGNAEPRLGRFLKGRNVDGLLISTKIGTKIASDGSLYKDWDPVSLLDAIDASRSNLGLDTIPLVYLHGPRPKQFTAAVFDVLSEARHRGWVNWFGVNSHDDDVLEALVGVDFFDVVMPDYNFLRIDRESVIERLTASGKVVFAGAAMANHVHAPKFLFPQNRVEIWYLLRALKNHRRSFMNARKLDFLRRVDNWTPSQIAIGFALANKNIKTAMFGTTNIDHLEENFNAVDRCLPSDLIRKIRDVKLRDQTET